MAKDCEYWPIVMFTEEGYVAGVTCESKLAIQSPPRASCIESMEYLLFDIARTLADCFSGSMDDQWTKKLRHGSLVRSQPTEQSEGRAPEYEHSFREGEAAAPYTSGDEDLRPFDYGHDEEAEMGAGSLGSRGHPGRRGSEMIE